jgi:DNA-binding CsgD family transcriptional regulator
MDSNGFKLYNVETNPRSLRDKQNSDFSSYPKVNNYFGKGVLEVINSASLDKTTNDVTLVDFRVCHINRFITTHWLSYLKGRKLIVISDRYMIPLARFYQRKHDGFFSVLHTSIPVKMLKNEVSKASKCDVVEEALNMNSNNLLSLNTDEIVLLKQLLKGNSITSVAKKMGANYSQVYNRKNSLTVKMGVSSINELNRLVNRNR